jgi:Rha family phage regulatory protein
MNAIKKSDLVHVINGKVFANSLTVADLFDKQHKNILARIQSGFASQDDEIVRFSRLNFKLSDYKNTRGKSYECYEMTEQGFIELAMSFTGDKARKIRINVISEFEKLSQELARIKSEPTRKDAVIEKRETAKFMTDSLIFARDLPGKKTNVNHYTNEHLFCNRALTGDWQPLDESTLDTYDLRMLKAIRERNAILIQHHPKQADRKQMLDDFVAEYKIKKPRLQLVIK